jgi:hypothetical protein
MAEEKPRQCAENWEAIDEAVRQTFIRLSGG